MRKTLPTILLVTLLMAILSSATLGQKQLLKEFHFEDGGYALIGIFAHMDDHPLQKKLGEFYTDDVAVLNSIKKAWVFRKPSPQHACGYHYYVLILHNGTDVAGYAINLDCHELATDDGSFIISDRMLEMFGSKFKHLYRKYDQFDSPAVAREYWRKIHQDKNFIYADEPKWLEFEGEFSFNVKCAIGVKDCYKKAENMAPALRDAIAEAYPGEPFKLGSFGGTKDELWVRVICNKTLEGKFKLYDRWDKEAFGKWEPYHLDLYSHWTTKTD